MTPACAEKSRTAMRGMAPAGAKTDGINPRAAYDERYLGPARIALGRMLDYAVNGLGYGLSRFWSLFLMSEASQRFEAGDATLTVGHSGVELAWLVLDGVGIKVSARPEPRYEASRSEEYWCGWALAYYQWSRAASFTDIDGCAPIERVLSLYHPYHEMDVRQFCERMDEECSETRRPTRLQTRRKLVGLSQSGLAAACGVPLRTIQQYEQRQKNINHARALQVAALARALHCEINDLLEPAYMTSDISW